MPTLGIVSDDEFLAELEKMNGNPIPVPSLPPVPLVQDIKTPGRRVGDIETPEVIRNLIGDTALTSGSSQARALAESLGLSKQSADAYANGSTSLATYNKKDKPLADFLKNRRKKIAAKASLLAINAIDGITEDKLLDASATELAAIAKSAAAIVKDMLPEDKSSQNNGNSPAVQFVIHAPQIAREEKFDVIDIRATEELQ